jgi:ABC-type multidrug transport system ATPase subunit
LAGVQRPSEGEVLLAGHPVNELRHDFPLAIGYLPQFGAFHRELAVSEILGYASKLRLPPSVTAEVKEKWIAHIVDVARIRALLRQTPPTLSGGQMRRLALGEELIGDPAFLLLDELTSGLDTFSDQEMMLWLRDLAHNLSKTVVLVTHSTNYLHLCDAIIFLHEGKLVHYGTYQSLLENHRVDSVSDLFRIYQDRTIEGASTSPEVRGLAELQPLRTAKPPSGWTQLPTLVARQFTLLWRDKPQLILHLVLAATFPLLVAVFAYKGLPQVRNLALTLERNILLTLQEQLLYLRESFKAASLISGLSMFQVILLTLVGANNGAREIAKENVIVQKELRAGLSPAAYVGSKFLQIVGLVIVQSFWMAWFVKTICGFPGDLLAQFAILFATTLAMSVTCLAISAAASSAERASLLAIYLVGFQLPLSGAALSLPAWLSDICRPFIVAYWGWSGYLQTLHSTRHYDIVRQSTQTTIADYGVAMAVLLAHVLVALAAAVYFVGRKNRTA